MIVVRLRDAKTMRSIDSFKVLAVPRVGEIISLFYRKILNNKQDYIEEAVIKAKTLDGSSWVVHSVEYELAYGEDEDRNWIWVNVGRA